MEEIAEGTRFVIDGQVFTYIGDGEDAAGQPVAHLRGGDSDSLEEYPKEALQEPRARLSHGPVAPYPRPGIPTRG